MYDYTIIDCDKALDGLLETWRSRGVSEIAMDFEGEFNLHIYGEHLCLIQIFDRTSYYLIDPFKVSPEALRRFLEAPDITKLMFDCASDSALVRKEYGIKLTTVYDVRVPALALGFTGNLTGLVDRCKAAQPAGNAGPPSPNASAQSKKKNQMTNWLIRPLKDEQVRYALSDVEHLFELKDCLEAEIKGTKLEKEVAAAMKGVALPKGPDKPGWVKVCNWKLLPKDQRIYLKHFFIARDTLAKEMNVPAVRVLDKRVLVDMARNVPETEDDFHRKAWNRDKRVEDKLVTLLLQAKQAAVTELAAPSGKAGR